MALGFATKLGATSAILILFLAGSVNAETPSPSTGIEGVVSIGPIHGGPMREGEPSSKSLANVTFDVTGDAGVVKSFTTDDSGHFRISLPPGHYSIKPRDLKTKPPCGPFQVEVKDGFKKVTWDCDSGMR